MSIVTLAEIKNFIGITESYSEEPGIATDDAITSLHLSVEKFVKTYCKKDIEQTAYSKEIYYDNGRNLINLNNYPLIYVDRVAVGTRDAIKIRNSNVYSFSSVSVSSTGLRLVKDGVADETVLFATYTTLSDVVTAINLISGWQAEVIIPAYGTIVSTELVDRYAASTIDENWIWLEIPETAESNIEVFPNEGQIVYYSKGGTGYNEYYGGYYKKVKSNPTGSNVIYVDYTAGYSTANMPDDIKLAVKILFKALYDRRDQSGFGLAGYTISRIKVFYEKQTWPKEVTDTLNRYKKVKV